jgi:hypothetical protein
VFWLGHKSMAFEKQARQGASDRRVHQARKEACNAAWRGLSKVSGGLAQLGEHLLCKQGVVGSIPSSSTNFFNIKVINTKAVSQETALLLTLASARINRLFFNNS